MQGRKPSRNRVRRALAVSLVLHGLVAVVLVARRPQRPAVDEAVEVTLESDRPGTSSPASVVPIPARAPERSAPARASVSRGRDGERQNDRDVRAREGASALGAAEHSVDEKSAVVAQDVPTSASGLGTFAPARPDLTVKAPLGDAPRDILAAPTIKGGARSGELPRQLQGGAGVTATVGEDGSIRFDDPKGVAMDKPSFKAVGEGAGVGFSGHFDVTDQVMKLAGQDPYGSIKRTMAEETREQRLCMAERFRGERQKQELFQLSTKVRRIAGRADLSAARRRELIFEIWDECLEDADSPTDYGSMARATIAAIVRDAFPEGSELGYRPAELLALNSRRTSRASFAPYAAEPGRRFHRPDAGTPPPSCP
jgi:hypothetical protein